MKLATLGARLQTMETRRAAPPPKSADPFYASASYRIWRADVIARAGGHCEAEQNGGARFDVANGQCLCGSHHSAKTAQARSARRGA
jgi:hypothetical protein